MECKTACDAGNVLFKDAGNLYRCATACSSSTANKTFQFNNSLSRFECVADCESINTTNSNYSAGKTGFIYHDTADSNTCKDACAAVTFQDTDSKYYCAAACSSTTNNRTFKFTNTNSHTECATDCLIATLTSESRFGSNSPNQFFHHSGDMECRADCKAGERAFKDTDNKYKCTTDACGTTTNNRSFIFANSLAVDECIDTCPPLSTNSDLTNATTDTFVYHDDLTGRCSDTCSASQVFYEDAGGLYHCAASCASSADNSTDNFTFVNSEGNNQCTHSCAPGAPDDDFVNATTATLKYHSLTDECVDDCPSNQPFYIDSNSEYRCTAQCTGVSNGTDTLNYQFINSNSKEQCTKSCPPTGTTYLDSTTATLVFHTTDGKCAATCGTNEVIYEDATGLLFCAADCSAATPAAPITFVNSEGKNQCTAACPPTPTNFSDGTTATLVLHTTD
jgi:hypothetical protein